MLFLPVNLNVALCSISLTVHYISTQSVSFRVFELLVTSLSLIFHFPLSPLTKKRHPKKAAKIRQKRNLPRDAEGEINNIAFFNDFSYLVRNWAEVGVYFWVGLLSETAMTGEPTTDTTSPSYLYIISFGFLLMVPYLSHLKYQRNLSTSPINFIRISNPDKHSQLQSYVSTTNLCEQTSSHHSCSITAYSGSASSSKHYSRNPRRRQHHENRSRRRCQNPEKTKSLPTHLQRACHYCGFPSSAFGTSPRFLCAASNHIYVLWSCALPSPNLSIHENVSRIVCRSYERLADLRSSSWR